MSCSRRNDERDNERDDEQLTALAAGGLSPLAAWRLRHHLDGCAECDARWKETQQLWMGLRGIASVPVPKTLQDRVCGLWPPLSPRKRTQPMKKRMVLLTCTLLLVGITAAMASHMIGYHPSGGFGKAGQMWNFTTNLKGRMTVLDGEGRKIGQFTNDGTFMTDAAGPESAWVRMNVAGQDHVIHGPGRHEMKDANGQLLGYIVLSDVSEAEMYRGMGWSRAPRDFKEAAQWVEAQDPASGGGASGVETSPTGRRGFDKALGVSWKMRGYGTVKATLPNGDRVAESTVSPISPDLAALLPPGFVPDADATPEWTLTVLGKATQETGYGRHVLKDSSGKPLMILEATPLASK